MALTLTIKSNVRKVVVTRGAIITHVLRILPEESF